MVWATSPNYGGVSVVSMPRVNGVKHAGGCAEGIQVMIETDRASPKTHKRKVLHTGGVNNFSNFVLNLKICRLFL